MVDQHYLPHNPPACDGEQMLLAVYRAAERVTAELDLDRALEEIIACVRHPLGLDRAGIFIYRRQRADLVRLIGVGQDGSVEHGSEVSIPISDERGPMQQVVQGRIPYFHSHDVRRDVAPEVQMPSGLGAHAIVPLVNRGEIIGAMAVDNMLTGRDISEGMIRPLCLFAHFAALALGNALRAHELGDLNRKLQRLAELTGAFSGILEPAPLLECMLAEVPDLLRADRYSAWRRRSEGAWECMAVRGLSTDYIEAVGQFYADGGLPGSLMERLLLARGPVFIPDVRSDPALQSVAALIEQEGFHSILAIPLCHGSDLLGCVNLHYDDAPEHSGHDMEIAGLFARHAGTALRNADLFEAGATLEQRLRLVNQELQADKQLLLARQEELRHSETQKKQFYRDVLYAVTNGKMLLCDREEISRDWGPETAAAPVQTYEDVKCCRDLVQQQAQAAGMPHDRVNDLCLCASEATTNALKHAGGGQMSIAFQDDQIRIRITDNGGGIDTMQLPHATLLRGYSTRASMGLGFTLMHEMSDRIRLASDSEGTILILEMAVHPESEQDRALSMLKLEEF